jgi:hypothetical protein
MLKRLLQIIPALGFLLVLVPSAHAILGAGDIVSDPATETNTAETAGALGTANTTLSSIQASAATTALSVSRPGDPGLYQGVSQYLDMLDGELTGAGISAAAMAVLFPGWVPLLPDAITQNASIATMGLATYQAAVQVAQTQATDFDAESVYLTSIEGANVGSTGLLQAIQISTEAQLATATQIQMLRQLMISLITIEALRNGEELNERAQAGATSAQTISLGISPQ